MVALTHHKHDYYDIFPCLKRLFIHIFNDIFHVTGESVGRNDPTWNRCSVCSHWPLVDTDWILNQFLKLISRIDISGGSCELALMWVPQDFIDDYSPLVQVLAWCRQARSHYLNLRAMSPSSITRPHWARLVGFVVPMHDGACAEGVLW